MSSTGFVAFDVETTGLSASRGDRIIEIGAVALEGGKIIDEFHSLINVRKRISMQAQYIHGITGEMLKGRPGPDRIFPEFRAFAGKSTLIAHNAGFDLSFLRHEYGRIGLGFHNKHICTLELSRRSIPRLRNHRLETVYRHLFGKSKKQLHRALDDARMVAKIWLELTEK